MRAEIAVEICIDASDPHNAESALLAAWKGGADRVEVCAAMDVGGVTPDRQRIRTARSIFVDRPGVVCMIRPRGGDFFYSPAEIDAMSAHIEGAAEAGANGVALGALQPSDSSLDVEAMRHLTDRARALGLAVTLHRAFDATPNRAAALETAIELGVQRVLSSGTPWGSDDGALTGLSVLEQLCAQASGRLELIAAGRICPQSAQPIARALGASTTPLSLHAFSGACAQGATSAALVDAIKTAANRDRP